MPMKPLNWRYLLIGLVVTVVLAGLLLCALLTLQYLLLRRGLPL